MITAKPKHRNKFIDFNFTANTDIIHNKPTIKILGITLRNNLSMETQIGTLCANLHSRIHTIRQITPFTTFHTRLQLIKSIVIGKLTYALPTYTQITDKLNIRIHRVIMAAARTIIGNYCFKKSINYILDKCKLLDSKDMIAFASIKYKQNIII